MTVRTFRLGRPFDPFFKQAGGGPLTVTVSARIIKPGIFSDLFVLKFKMMELV